MLVLDAVLFVVEVVRVVVANCNEYYEKMALGIVNDVACVLIDETSRRRAVDTLSFGWFFIWDESNLIR